MATQHPLSTVGFGSLLRRARGAAGLTQRELAAASGVSVRSVSELERGRNRGPHRATVEALADALGVPRPLREELHRAAAAGRAARRRGTASAPPAPAPAPESARPAFPARPSHFTGRERELAGLRPPAAAAAEGTNGTAVVATVSGQPGVGKTALALHLAHEYADRFPDGRFHLGLGGTGARPMRSGEALTRLLRAMGAPADRIPCDDEERGALYRSLAHGRRMLLLLDDAAGEGQVRPLLPGGPRCLVLVTSRRTLAGLESAARIHLGVLSTAEAVRLLDRTAGGGTIAAEPGAAGELVRLCGHLPLALGIAGSRLADAAGRSGPAPVQRLVGLLHHEEHRLDRLSHGDRHVRTAFEPSYRQLTPRAREVFRLLALVPGPDIDAGLAASLTALTPLGAGAVLDELVDAGLLEPAPTAFRYRFHELVRIFAAEALRTEDSPAGRAAAESRMAEELLRRAAAAGRAAAEGAGGRTAAAPRIVCRSTHPGAADAAGARAAGATGPAGPVRRCRFVPR